MNNIMGDNFDLLSAELCKLTKPMLFEFILKESVSSSIKINEGLLSLFNRIITETNVPPTTDPFFPCGNFQVLSNNIFNFYEYKSIKIKNSLDFLVFSNCSTIPEDKHHPAIVFNIPVSISSHSYFNFYKADYDRISSFLLSFNNWNKTFLNLNDNDVTNTFYDTLHFCILHYVPLSAFYKQLNFPRWFSKKLRDSVIRKKELMLCSSPQRILMFFYQFFFFKYKIESKKCHFLYIQNIESSFLSKPRVFCDFVKTDLMVVYLLAVNVKFNGVLSSKLVMLMNYFHLILVLLTYSVH